MRSRTLDLCQLSQSIACKLLQSLAMVNFQGPKPKSYLAICATSFFLYFTAYALKPAGWLKNAPLTDDDSTSTELRVKIHLMFNQESERP
mmetsp:Transcript_33145/g.88015  ORF Transcript_33145/g.88015 Transcript_33145/m.88015 type:complete len:90 (-) Transcript_33145:132-401(-)